MLQIPLINLLLLAAKQELYKMAYFFTKNTEEFSGKSSGVWTSGQKKDQTERVTRLGRRTREETVKWNQMTALRFHTWGETSDIPGLLGGGSTETKFFVRVRP